MDATRGAFSERAELFAAKSAPLLDLLRAADDAAKSASSVLVLGENGVGKRRLVRRLHAKSPRAQKPFVRVNCAAAGDFGEDDFRRWARAAMGGTIFFDEVAALPPSAQIALLRLLKEKGGAGAFEGVRVAAASSRDLERLAKEKKFLDDLFFRLNAVQFRIPPLRERPDDILPLAEYFLAECSDKTKKNFTGLSDGAKEALLAWRWPGNARELKNVLERSCLLEEPPLVTGRFFPFVQGGGQGSESAFAFPDGRPLKDAVNEFKKYYVARALQKPGTRQADAAASLGIQRTYLSRLLLELGIRKGE